MELKVVEECHVSPPPGSVPNSSLPLTFFDLVFLPMPAVQRLYFYESHYSDTHFINSVLPNIKNSLSLTLQHFYPLAGNLTWPQGSTVPELAYKEGDYVSLTVAESDYNFHQLSDSKSRDAIDSTPLIPKFRSTSEEGTPLLALQVTFFPTQGICIGITISHAASDGRTSNHFMKTWASFCKLEGDNNNPSLHVDSYPFYGRSILSYLNPKEEGFMTPFGKLTKEKFQSFKSDHEAPVDKIWGTFVMGVAEIKRLKQSVSAHFDKLNEVKPTFHFSSFVVTCAYVWRCYVKARCGETGVSETLEHLFVPIDVRQRLDPPLPVTYFGNCVSVVSAMVKTSELIGKDGVAIAAMSIRKAIENVELFPQIREKGEPGKDMPDFPPLVPEHIIGIASSPKFGVYETDFGWGKPKRVEMSSIHTGQSVSVIECPNEQGAIEIGVVRQKKEMDAFLFHFENSLSDIS